MKKIDYFTVIVIIFIFNNVIFSTGNPSHFELGTAMYRKLAQGVVYRNHWHTACFNYFKIDLNSQMGTMYYTEAQGLNHPTTGKSQHRTISVANYEKDLENLKNDIKNYFKSGII